MIKKRLTSSVATRSAAVLALVAIGIAEANAAGLIGINFADGGKDMASSAIAGVVPQDFFNNIATGPSPGGTGLLNDDGLATSVAFTGSGADGGFHLGMTPTTPDANFMDGYLDVGADARLDGSQGVTLNFTGLNSLTGGQAYSVLIYTDGDSASNRRRGQFTLSNATAGNGVYVTEDNGNFPANGTAVNYVRSLATTNVEAEALTGINNYVRFDGVTGNTFTINAFGSGGLDGDARRAPINGIQIVTVPEPSTLFSLVGSVGMLLSLRRRTR